MVCHCHNFWSYSQDNISNENPEVKPYPTETKSRLRYARGTAYTWLDLDLKPNYVCRDLNPCSPGCDIGYIYSVM